VPATETRSDNTDQAQTQAGNNEQSQKPASGNRPPRSRYNRSGRRRQKSDKSGTDENTNDQSAPAMKIVSDNPNPSSSGNDHKPAEVSRQSTSTNSRPDQTAGAKLEGVKSAPDKTTHLEPRSSSDNKSRPAATNRSANLKQVETSSSGPAGNVEKSSDAKKNVSSLQPSQLKSTVRSLADKETTPAAPAKPKDAGPKLQKIETKDHDTDHS